MDHLAHFIMPFKSKNIAKLLSVLIIFFLSFNCKKDTKYTKDSQPNSMIAIPEGMVWVAAKTFLQGAKEGDGYAMPKEAPVHHVHVDGFFIDITEVTNKQFSAFVEATNYVTVAERPIDWEVMKKELPPNAPKPHDSIMQPGSLIFNKDVNAVVNMHNYNQWWTWKIGANWRHPSGPDSNIEGKDNYPVVHIAYEDALAYCKWANRRLPTEAEWEAAAQGTYTDAIFTWGDNPELLNKKANTWQGVFPVKNEALDGFEYIAPVKSFEPNTIGLYDMTGNVWELTSDYYNTNYYKTLGASTTIINPKGAKTAYNPMNPYAQERIIKGGSFLCHASYCASYRISAKMSISPDSSSDHTGFRTVVTVDMLKNDIEHEQE